MRHTNLLFGILAVAATVAGCSNVDEVTLTGPSVTDQLNSRGYIATSADTTLSVDTTKLQLDSPERR
jgi:hypothetical protein